MLNIWPENSNETFSVIFKHHEKSNKLMLHVLPKIAWEHIKLNGAFVCHSAMRPMPIWSISFLLDWCPKYTNSTQYTARPGENNLISLMHRFLQAAAVLCCKPQKLILFIGKAKKIESGTKSRNTMKRIICISSTGFWHL